MLSAAAEAVGTWTATFNQTSVALVSPTRTADDIARVTQAGLHEAPPESGNVAAGFMATAAQAARVSFPGPARAALAGAGPRPGSRTAAHDPRRRRPGPDVSGPTR
jgi:hypothetical protein